MISKDDVQLIYLNAYDEAESDVIHQALRYKKGDKLTYTRLTEIQLTLVWESFMRMGIVLRPKIVDRIQEVMLYNTCILTITTAGMHHDNYDPFPEWKDEYCLTSYQLRKIKKLFLENDEWAAWSNGQYFVSDYAIPRLNKYLLKALETDIYEQKITWLDAMLNVAHQRSDIAELYVIGGSKTLTKLSSSPSEKLEAV